MTDQPTEAAREPELSNDQLFAVWDEHNADVISYDRPAFDPDLLRAAIALDRAARALTQGDLARAVLDLNKGWNAKETESLIGERIDLCRRLANAALAAAPSALVASPVEMQDDQLQIAEDIANSLCAMIGEISNALGISEDEQSCASGADEILDAIKDLKEAELYLGLCLDDDRTLHATIMRKESDGNATVLLSDYVTMPRGQDIILRASLAAIPVAASQLAKDFPPMGGLTECDMGDSYE